MKIIIVGGGISGLTAYMSLKKHLPAAATQDVKIYERHGGAAATTATPATTPAHGDGAPRDRIVIGGGLGLAPNGLRAAHTLSPAAHARITAAGFPVASYELRTAGNSVLGSFPAGTERPTRQRAVMTSWHALWAELRKEVPAEGVLCPGRKVARVEAEGAVVFDDGVRERADLVIGADGARSVCRWAVLDEGEAGDAEFNELVGFGGFVRTASLPPVPKSSSEVVMTFGQKGFFGYAPCNTAPDSPADSPQPGDKTMWWSTFASSTPQCPAPGTPAAQTKLQETHADCTNPIIRHIAGNARPELSTSTWTAPKLRRWSKGRVVLVGDAAHALPSTSGQGVSQALEDAVTLGILLKTALDAAGADETLDDARIAAAAARYERLRKPRVERIRDAAVGMQGKKRHMRPWELWFMYAAMWLGMKLAPAGAAATYEFDAEAAANAEAAEWRRGEGGSG